MDSNLLLLALEVKKLKKKVSAPPMPIKGNKGDKGDKGETGAKGADGVDGAKGPKGDKGDKGDAGKDGIIGADGVSVVDAEIDIDGTLAFSLSNGETIKTSGEVVGPKGPPGMQGTAGVGVSSGGTTGQVLVKNSNTNYDTAWQSISTGGGNGTVTSVGGTGSVNGISLSGSVTSSGNLTLGGTLDLSSPPTIGNTTPEAGSFTTLIGGAGSANYEQITGGATTKAVQFQTLGSDANISVAVQPKGTGAIDLAAGSSGVNISNGNTVTAITRTSPGANYTSAPTWSASAPTTVGGTTASGTTTLGVAAQAVSAGGTGYTVSDVLTFVGGTGTAATATVTTVSSGVITAITMTSGGSYSVAPTSPVSVTGGTGTGATFTLSFGVNSNITISTGGLGYVEQPTITFSGGGGSGAAAYAVIGSATTLRSLNGVMSFNTPAGEGLRLFNSAFSPLTDYIEVRGGASVAGAYLTVNGSTTNANLYVSSKNTGNVQFFTNNSQQEQLRVAHTASAVNYVQVTGGATGSANGVTISAQGSDTDVNLRFVPKNAGYVSVRQDNVASTGILLQNRSATGTPEIGVRFITGSFDLADNRYAEISSTGGSSNTLIFKVSNGAAPVEMARISSTGDTTFGGLSTAPNFKIVRTNSAANYPQVTGSISGAAPVFSAQGTDTNIDLTLTPKGTGRVNITTSIKPKVNSVASVTSPLAWDSTSFDEYAITALANALTINADANAAPADGQRMMFRFKDNGTARALTWTTGSTNSFRVVGVTLPTTTVASKLVYVGCIYNAADSRWDAVAVSQEA